MNTEKNNVEKYIHDIEAHSPNFHSILTKVRKLFLKSCSPLKEDVKYGGLVFFKDNDLIGGIFVYKEHISVEFSHGAELHDPDSTLEGKGKYRRHIKLKKEDDIKKKNLLHFIQLATSM